MWSLIKLIGFSLLFLLVSNSILFAQKTYIVKRNENLSFISARKDIYNTPFAWWVIYNANKQIIDSLYKIKPGISLIIPDLNNEQKKYYDSMQYQYFKNNFNNEIKRILNKSKQIIIVITSGWDTTHAKLRMYQKKNSINKWQLIGNEIDAMIGRSGLGWGIGKIQFDTRIGPVKSEGDGRAPAGIFEFGEAFGYLPADSVKWIKFPYLQSTDAVECVDDPSSLFYNQLVDTTIHNKNWNSYESMHLKNNLYKYGIYIKHNCSPEIPFSGSCIFLHIWMGLGIPTSGCTATDEENIHAILSWLQPKEKPLLIQLPQEEFEKIRGLIQIE